MSWRCALSLRSWPIRGLALTWFNRLPPAGRRRRLVPDFLAVRGLSILTAIIILQLIAGFEVRPDVRWLLRWYGVGILCVGLTGSDFLLTALELFHVRSLLALIQQALYAAGVLILIKSPKDIIWVPASILASALVTNLAGWLALWHNGFRPTLVITPRRWRAMLVPSFHYAATSMMATVYHRTGHIVVRWFLGDYALGLYTAAVRFVDILRNFVNVGLSVLMPRMALTAKSRAGLDGSSMLPSPSWLSPAFRSCLGLSPPLIWWCHGCWEPVIRGRGCAGALDGGLYARGSHCIAAVGNGSLCSRAVSRLSCVSNGRGPRGGFAFAGIGSRLRFGRGLHGVHPSRTRGWCHCVPVDSPRFEGPLEKSHRRGCRVFWVADGGGRPGDEFV